MCDALCVIKFVWNDFVMAFSQEILVPELEEYKPFLDRN